MSECASGFFLPGIVGIYYVEIEPESSDIDAQLWIVVGDVPPAYLVLDESPKPSDALEGYLENFETLVSTAERGEDTSECMPLFTAGGGKNLDPSKELIAMLRGRIEMLREEILPAVLEGEVSLGGRRPNERPRLFERTC